MTLKKCAKKNFWNRILVLPLIRVNTLSNLNFAFLSVINLITRELSSQLQQSLFSAPLTRPILTLKLKQDTFKFRACRAWPGFQERKKLPELVKSAFNFQGQKDRIIFPKIFLISANCWNDATTDYYRILITAVYSFAFRNIYEKLCQSHENVTSIANVFINNVSWNLSSLSFLSFSKI